MQKSWKQFKSGSMLMLAALIWGTAFVAQSAGMDYIGPCTFNMVRNFIGSLVLLPVVLLAGKRNITVRESPEQAPVKKHTLLWGGLGCGALLCGGSLLQQAGIQYTSVGKAGFLTALYIVLVPILGIFLGKRAGMKIWLSVAVALVGTFLLSVTGDLTIGMGDLLVILGALFFSLHILLIDRLSGLVDGVKLSCLQFFVSGLISLVFAFALETPRVSEIAMAWLPLLYAGVISSGVGYTFQILGQRGINPTVASLILSLESVFAAVSGWLLLGQSLSGREIFGCALVFGAVILAQLPEKRSSEKITCTNVPKCDKINTPNICKED